MDQGQGQDQAQGHEKVRHRSAELQLQMALSLVMAMTLVHFANPRPNPVFLPTHKNLYKNEKIQENISIYYNRGL